MLLESFPPCWSGDAKVLILGSMPGKISLDEAQYYAHPRNLFWSMISQVVAEPMPSAYVDKLTWLKQNNVALWDVLKHCAREGSLDSRIERVSEVPNALEEIVASMPSLKLIAFNGKKAEQLFQRHCVSILSESSVEFVSLPSTSPANASISREEKLRDWQNALSRYIC